MARIRLIPFDSSDIDRLLGWIRSPEELMLWTASSFGFPLTREHIEGHLRDSAERGDRRIFKAVEESGEAVGHIELGAIDPRNRSVRIGRVLVDPNRRGRGLGAAMTRAALEIAFQELGAHRVELGVFDVNPGAIACYERVGFQRDGMRRDSFLVSKQPARYWSEVIMSVLATGRADRDN
ncbi:MAG TPA: GNAT family protein [Thermoanaerobaculia bacterium]|jgi:RimJ/RimL family protein N-acetyltransferase|nr:GNAT family protein [Thermoanaerobaculia bacterium]